MYIHIENDIEKPTIKPNNLRTVEPTWEVATVADTETELRMK